MKESAYVGKVIDILKKLVKKESYVIFDIGARDCLDSVAMKKLVPSSVYAFECDPTAIIEARKNAKGIVLVEKAISDIDGEISFYKADSLGNSSIFEIKEPVINQEKITVPAIKLDTFSTENKINEVDLMWMDMQGGELKAFMGGVNLLNNVKVINIEVEHVEIYKGQPLFWDIKKFLNAQGFKLYTFSAVGNRFSDVMFVNTKIYKPWTPEIVIYVWYKGLEKIQGKIRKLLM